MHEFAICARIVDAVLKEYAQLDPKPNRLIRARVVVRSMHQIVPDYLISAFELLTRETAVQGATMELVTVPVTSRCRACDRQGEIKLPIFRCDACGSLDLEASGGKELYLDSLEVEWNDEAMERGKVHEGALNN